MAEEVDPLGQRTLGVLTKPDLVDPGGEEHVMDLVRGIKNKLNLGYCMVRNRGQQDKSLSTTDRHEQEKQFFNEGRATEAEAVVLQNHQICSTAIARP